MTTTRHRIEPPWSLESHDPEAGVVVLRRGKTLTIIGPCLSYAPSTGAVAVRRHIEWDEDGTPVIVAVSTPEPAATAYYDQLVAEMRDRFSLPFN